MSMANPPIDGTAIRCTCCPRRTKLAEIHGTTIAVKGGHGNHQHYTEVTVKQLLEKMAGTVGIDGVSQYVKKVYK
jgi:hypothetical protein